MDYLNRANQLRADIAKNMREYGDAISKARIYTDEYLTPEGLTRHRQELVTQARTKYEGVLAELQTDLANTVKWAQDDAKRARDTASVRDIDSAWANAKTRLDAGMPFQTVIANADTAEVLAMAKFAPAYMDAQHYAAQAKHGVAAGAYQPPSLDNLERAIDERLAATLGEAGSPILTAREVAGVQAGIIPMLNQARANAAGMSNSGSLAAAIEANLASAAITGNNPNQRPAPQPAA